MQGHADTPTHSLQAAHSMHATIELDDQTLSEVMQWTQAKDVAGAVQTAIAEYLRLARRRQLVRLPGQVTMDENWHELDAAESDT